MSQSPVRAAAVSRYGVAVLSVVAAVLITLLLPHRVGGRLWASPNEPHGATFQFTLPAEEAAQHDRG